MYVTGEIFDLPISLASLPLFVIGINEKLFLNNDDVKTVR
jgi:hypothetical protein